MRHILDFVHMWFFGPEVSYHLTMIFMTICKLNCCVLKDMLVMCVEETYSASMKRVGKCSFIMCLCVHACVCMHACLHACVYACVCIEDAPAGINTCEKMFPALSNFPP